MGMFPSDSGRIVRYEYNIPSAEASAGGSYSKEIATGFPYDPREYIFVGAGLEYNVTNEKKQNYIYPYIYEDNGFAKVYLGILDIIWRENGYLYFAYKLLASSSQKKLYFDFMKK